MDRTRGPSHLKYVNPRRCVSPAEPGQLISLLRLAWFHRHFPRLRRHGEWRFDPSYLRDVDGRRREFDRPVERDRCDEAIIELLLAVDLDRRQQARHRR